MRVTPARIRRAAGAFAAALALGLTAVAAVPPAAQAASPGLVDITCPLGAYTTNISPPLTNTQRPTTFDSTENLSCTSLLSGVSSGTTHRTSTIDLSCLLFLQPPTAQQTVTYSWNTGQSSTVTYVSYTIAMAANGTRAITKVGAVTQGLGIGEIATEVLVIPSLSLNACATTGISTQTGDATLAILPA
jgi:hypothetical protein